MDFLRDGPAPGPEPLTSVYWKPPSISIYKESKQGLEMGLALLPSSRPSPLQPEPFPRPHPFSSGFMSPSLLYSLPQSENEPNPLEDLGLGVAETLLSAQEASACPEGPTKCVPALVPSGAVTYLRLMGGKGAGMRCPFWSKAIGGKAGLLHAFSCVCSWRPRSLG